MELGSKWNGWIVDSFIGEGSFGRVYKIKREELGYTYESALKVIRIPQSRAELTAVMNEGMSEESATAYFRSMVEDIVEEFALMSKLRGHSNIVSFEDHQIEELEDDFGWEIFIRMELLTPLFDYLKVNTFTTRDVIRLGIDMCKALELCQKYNIIHRDIKPENIFVTEYGSYKLGDFGIARQLEKTTAGLSKKGTFTYMAPEVYKGQPYNSTVDIYSLGIVLYRFMNNNRTPFLPPYPEQIRFSDRENANVLRMSGQSLPEPCNSKGRLSEIILKACAYDPRERYDSASEMRRELESLEHTEEMSKIIYPAGDMPGSEIFGTEQSVVRLDDDLTSRTWQKTDYEESNVIDSGTDETVSLFDSIFPDPPPESTQKPVDDHPGESSTPTKKDHSGRTDGADNKENQSKPNKKTKVIIAVVIVSLIIIVAVVIGFLVGKNNEQIGEESGDTSTKPDTSMQRETSHDEDGSSHYEENGICFDLSWDTFKSYEYTPVKGNCHLSLVEGSRNEKWEGLKAYWNSSVEWAIKQIKEEGSDAEVLYGEVTVDGQRCYWMEWPGTEWWSKYLYLPQDNDHHYIELSVSCDTKHIEEAKTYFDQLVDEIEFVGGSYQPSGSEICRFGICFPGHDESLEMIAYFNDSGDESSLDPDSITLEFDCGDYVDGNNEWFKWTEDMLKERDDTQLVDSGELEIDGVEAKWYTYNATYDQNKKYGEYFLMIPNEATEKIIGCTFMFSGEIEEHDDTIKEITDTIHLID